jgi:hypothetical protein
MERLSNPQTRYRLTRHQIPTHLNVPDKILSFWGFGITVRQLLILLLGWSGVANAWVRLGWLAAGGAPGGALHIAVTVIPALIAIFVAFKQVAGRPLEVWLMVLLRYWGQPGVCLWRRVCRDRREQPRGGEARVVSNQRRRGESE